MSLTVFQVRTETRKQHSRMLKLKNYYAGVLRIICTITPHRIPFRQEIMDYPLLVHIKIKPAGFES